jgi:hypothetical protein
MMDILALLSRGRVLLSNKRLLIAEANSKLKFHSAIDDTLIYFLRVDGNLIACTN